LLKYLALLAYIIIDGFRPPEKQDKELKELFK